MYTWRDKLRDWASQQGAWTHILTGAGIALVVTAIILAAAMPSKGAISTNADEIDGLRTSVNSIAGQLGLKASKSDVEDDIEGLEGAIGAQAGDINFLGDRVSDLEGEVEELDCSPAEAYLTGTFPKYTLHVSGEPGDYTAVVHLVYQPAQGAAGNYTQALADFYAGVMAPAPAYVPVVTCNGTVWGVSEVWWNIGTFVVAADTETAVAVTCLGLNSTWEPGFAYVEVWAAL